MLRRKAKRQLESLENEEITGKKHVRRKRPSEDKEADDLEKLVFGDQHYLDLDVDINTEVCFTTYCKLEYLDFWCLVVSLL